MPPRKAFDLKSVGKLFNDTLAAIRDEVPTTEALKPEAIEWLKSARYKLMRDIESAYYELEASRNTPLKRPTWVNPQGPLYLSTAHVPTMLEAYRPTFKDNLEKLLRSCGFCPGHLLQMGVGSAICITIYFPAQLAAPPRNPGPPAAPSQLDIEDEFSNFAKGGQFSASKFGQLLVDARGDSVDGGGSTSGASKKRRRSSRTVKDESDADDDTEGRRLRSVTRATSAATLRSSSEAPRRSSRKRLKQEE
ncbi:hypothetical protein DFH06DRAFT_368304 [Mycena polygramma]|nr:hypothetical protein DFH06DRAFT_368304 [Mycena polygramma]